MDTLILLAGKVALANMFHGVCALSQTILKMMFYCSVKKKTKNNSSSDVDKAITKIQTGDISQVKEVR